MVKNNGFKVKRIEFVDVLSMWFEFKYFVLGNWNK